MAWIKYEINTTTDAEDIISSILYDYGFTSVEITDRVPVPPEQLDGVFTEILPDEPEDDGLAIISFYIDEEDINKNLLTDAADRAFEELRTEYPKIKLEIVKSRLDNTDWAHNWKKYWHTQMINDLFIKPTWEETTPEMEGNKILSLDPGTAFGTGGHETTRLCITALQKLIVPGDKVLDIGCGSGILTVVAKLYGAGECLGTDLDKLAIKASQENLEANVKDAADVRFLRGNIVTDTAFKEICGYDEYDIIIANILPEVLVPLTDTVDRHMKPEAFLIYSGILNEKEDEVKNALKNNGSLQIIDTLYDGEWVAVIAQKK